MFRLYLIFPSDTGMSKKDIHSDLQYAYSQYTVNTLYFFLSTGQLIFYTADVLTQINLEVTFLTVLEWNWNAWLEIKTNKIIQ